MESSVLIIDNSKMMHALIGTRLADMGLSLHSAWSGEQGLQMARELLPDLILLDVDMPGMDGFETCRRLKIHETTEHIPVVFLSGTAAIDKKIEGLDTGAVDWVVKPFDPAELKARIRAALRTSYLVRQLTSAAMIDGMTGAWNRFYLERRFAAELSVARRRHEAVGLLLIHANLGVDTSEAMQYAAAGFQKIIRVEDILCRYSYDTFALLVTAFPEAELQMLSERMRICAQGCFPGLQISIGAATLMPGADLTLAQARLVDAAEQALAEARQSGESKTVMALLPSLKLDFAGRVYSEL